MERTQLIREVERHFNRVILDMDRTQLIREVERHFNHTECMKLLRYAIDNNIQVFTHGDGCRINLDDLQEPEFERLRAFIDTILNPQDQHPTSGVAV